MNEILDEERRRKILQKLQDQGTVKTSQLADYFSVSEMTIRRDLEELAGKGELKKVHGGAVANQGEFRPSYKGDTVAFEPTFKEKRKVNREEKKKIGQKAAEGINDGSAIFIGTGSTTMQVVNNLKNKKDLTVLTNSLNHGLKLSQFEDIEVLMTGGQLRPDSFALVGPVAKKSIDEVYVDTLIIGVNGVSMEQGLTIPSISEADTMKGIIELANEVVVVADYSKFGKVSHAKICDLVQVDKIITDDKIDSKYLEGMRELGVEVIIS